ncbi:RodZ domain-containing protein [Wenzhouxiangella marina]|uniref:Uncharacterized protein n=1 Tax=Wenzhouxiangella marina TaxID=1579979 RepID=A0A0K0XWB6_9GAMM|nr:RodZ domain-containing protein [Wenzhouxiangella marina]AKS41922.1 hypothetical protein WM2015_1552 [Wenzhouxiangella marina]MBB6086311.1 cytoskeleton protein RodZ [Wenzhouxiangella marina]
MDRSERFKAIGQRLLDERQAQGLSQAEVASRLHLSGLLLEDLERGRVERLAPLYRRGYISNYARLLGLDEAELLSMLDQEEPPRLTEVLPVRRPRFRFDRYMKFATYVLVTVAIVPPIIMIYLNTGAALFDAEEGSVTEGVERSLSLDLGASNAAPGAGAGTSSADMANGTQPISASTLPLSAIRARRPEELQASENDLAPIAPPAEALLEPESFELTVHLHEDSWIEITAGDDQRLEYDLLRSGQSRTYRGEPPFQVLIGRSSAVDLLLNGEPLSYEGHERADVVELTIGQDGQIQR